MHIIKYIAIALILVSFLTDPLTGSEQTTSSVSDFSIRDMNGKRIELTKLLANGPVVLDFWALWCVPCLKELPHLNTLYKKFKKQGLQVLAINEDDPSSENKVKPFIRGKRYSFQVAIDKDKVLWHQFKIVSLPTLILINQDGTVFKTHTGYRPGDEKHLEKEIEQFLQHNSEQKGTQE